ARREGGWTRPTICPAFRIRPRGPRSRAGSSDAESLAGTLPSDHRLERVPVSRLIDPLWCVGRIIAMNAHWDAIPGQAVSRRELLRRGGGGFAALALAGLLAGESRAGEPDPRHPVAPRPPHFPPRPRRAVFPFIHG